MVSTDSRKDIEVYVQQHSSSLPVEEMESRQILISRIVAKADGNFLWTYLIMRQLRDAYTLEDVESVLNEVPQEMFPLYKHNLNRLSDKASAKKLTKTLLVWVMCVLRPLTVGELKMALKIDADITLLRRLETSVSDLCAQLVYTNKQGKIVAMHQTARAFITSSDLDSEYRVDPRNGHLRIALACLKYLCSDQMRSSFRQSGTRKLVSNDQEEGLADYACSTFSEHIVQAESSSEELFSVLNAFLDSNVLFWIEACAETRDLSRLVRAAKHFKTYLSNRSVHTAPLRDNTVRSWAVDLPRIVAEFGKILITHPSAIFSLVPPLCPRLSIIHQTFAKEHDGIVLRGLSAEEWRDRIACLDHRNGAAKCITCQNQWIAVGLSNGSISVYDASTLQETYTLRQEQSVRIVKFDHNVRKLASASLHFVKLWDTSSASQLFAMSLDSVPFAIAFDMEHQSLIAATRTKQILRWQLSSGTPQGSRMLSEDATDVKDRYMSRVPQTVDISVEHNLLSATYRSLPVHLYNLQDMALVGLLQRPVERQGKDLPAVHATMFNPSPGQWLIAVAFWDAELFLFDTLNMTRVTSVSVSADRLAASQDGKTLATGDSFGRIHVLDFHSLKMLYCVKLAENGISGLSFTSDSLRLLDVRGSQMNVWEPSALIRKDAMEDESDISDATLVHIDTSGMLFDNFALITALKTCHEGQFALAGKNTGCVDLDDLANPKTALATLYSHKGATTEISAIEWNETASHVASVDIANCVKVAKLARGTESLVKVQKQLLDERIESVDPISHLVFSTSGKNLLVATSNAYHVWNLAENELQKHELSASIGHSTWVQHPQKPEHFLCLQDFTLSSFLWSDCRRPVGAIKLDLATNAIEMPRFDIFGFGFELSTLALLARTWGDSGSHGAKSSSQPGNKLFSIDISRLEDDSSIIVPLPCFSRMFRKGKAPEIEAVLGTVQMHESRFLVFVTRDGWVCSLNGAIGLQEDSYRRHFFLPAAWITGREQILGQITEKMDVLIVHGEEIAVISNGLANTESERPLRP